MKKKASDVTINLVPKDPFFSTTAGRTVQWALSAGRFIVIFTEVIVILSFAARFTLDLQITDLNKQLVQSQGIITSYGDLEKNFRLAQAQIAEYSQIQEETNISTVFENLTQVTPLDVEVETLSINPDSVSIQGYTYSQNSFNVFITNLQISPKFLNVVVNTVEARDNNAPGVRFQITADTREVKRVQTQSQETEPVNLLDRTQGL